MSDADERLSSFDPGPAMNPLPPSDVRRQGDRLRRRNTVLAGTGAALAVALIVTPIAILGSRGDSDASPDPAPSLPSPSVTTDGKVSEPVLVTVPDGFPLGDGMPDGVVVGDERPYGEIVMGTVEICGEPVWSARDATDLLGAVWSDDVEGGQQRTLAVYPDDASAEEAVRALALGDGDGCATGDPDSSTTVTPLNSEGTAGWVETYVREGRPSGARVWQLTLVGNALLLDKIFVAEQSDAATEQAAGDLADRASGVIDAMCVYSSGGCGAAEETPSAPEGSGEVPENFPLAAGWPDDADAEPGPDSGLTGPSPTLEPYAHTACGATTQAPEVTGVLRASWANPEDYRFRELHTFADTAAAENYVEAIIEVYSGCPIEETGDGFTWLRDVRDTGVGEEAYAMIQSSQYDGAPALGLQLVQVIRVGRAVLIDQAASEGTAADSRTQIGTQADRSAEVVSAMCAFTEAGC